MVELFGRVVGKHINFTLYKVEIHIFLTNIYSWKLLQRIEIF